MTKIHYFVLPILLIILAGVNACGKVDYKGFEKICRDNAYIDIRDVDAWHSYLQQLATDYPGDPKRNKTQVIRPASGFGFSVEAQNSQPDHSRSGEDPFRNDVFISLGGELVARITNYTLIFKTVDSQMAIQCFEEFPLLYRLEPAVHGHD